MTRHSLRAITFGSLVVIAVLAARANITLRPARASVDNVTSTSTNTAKPVYQRIDGSRKGPKPPPTLPATPPEGSNPPPCVGLAYERLAVETVVLKQTHGDGTPEFAAAYAKRKSEIVSDGALIAAGCRRDPPR